MEALDWRTSSYSTGNGACVEVAKTPATVLFRDTKDRGIPVVEAGASAWSSFIQAVQTGALKGWCC